LGSEGVTGFAVGLVEIEQLLLDQLLASLLLLSYQLLLEEIILDLGLFLVKFFLAFASLGLLVEVDLQSQSIDGFFFLYEFLCLSILI
jgi:hypothetical protein